MNTRPERPATCQVLVYVGGSVQVEPCGNKRPCREHANQIGPGDRVLWAAKNGTVRHGTVLRWEGDVGRWFVEFDADPALPHGAGFSTWFKTDDLIKVPDPA